MNSLELPQLFKRVSVSVVGRILDRLVALLLSLEHLALLHGFGLGGNRRGHGGDEPIPDLLVLLQSLELPHRGMYANVLGTTLFIHLG